MMGRMPSDSPYTDLLRLPRGPVDLGAHDPHAKPGFDGNKKKARPRSTRSATSSPTCRSGCSPRARRRQPRVLLVLQGMDTSGKGGILRHAVGLVDPQGLHIKSFKAPTAEERPRLPVARRARLPAAGHHRRLRPLALRGRADRPGPRAGAAGGDGGALRRDQRVREASWSTGASDREVHAAHLARRAEGAAAGPARRAHQALEVQPRRRRRAAPVGRVPGGLRGRPGAHQHRARALVRRARATASGTATSPSPRSCSRRCGDGPAAGRGRTTTSPSSGPGSRRRLAPDGARAVSATRYVTPLREGGSLPGIVEADDLGTYVCKFRGAGQGLQVLVAEVVVGELARRLGLRIPGSSRSTSTRQIASYEADEEVQDLLTASVGLNLGVDFLPGSFGFDGELRPTPTRSLRAVLWLDALHRQRRPQLAQPQPAGLARRPVGHRPRRLRCTSTTAGPAG